MSRSGAVSTSKSKGERVRDLPWAVMLQAAVVIARRWWSLSDKDRSRFLRLLSDSQGRLGNLTPKERGELRGLARKLDLRGMGRDLIAIARFGSGARRRGRGRR